MSVGTVCNREVIVVDGDESIQDAVALMRNRHVGDLVVIEARGDDKVPIGILTDRDVVVELAAAEVPLASVAVKDVMSRELITAVETEDVWNVLQRMRAKGVRRMPVVSADGALIGIFTADDAVELLAEGLTDLAGLARRERINESRTRG